MKRAKWTEKIKKHSCARKSRRMKNNAGTDKEEEKKLAGPVAKKELPAEALEGTKYPYYTKYQ